MGDHIRLEATDKELSGLGGLSFFSATFDCLLAKSPLPRLLPANKITTRCSALAKFKAMTLGLVAGSDCIDDMDRLREDPGFAAVNGGRVNAARTYDDYLQHFTHEQMRQMNREVLIPMALSLHKVQQTDNNFVLSVDSSDNPQEGEKIEGAAYNYKKTYGLDTLMGFDQYGHLLFHEVRPGNTYSANGSPTVIHEVFKQVPRDKHRYFLGDSAFCNSSVFTACSQARADFVIACRANMYGRFLGFVKSWQTSDAIKFYDGRKAEIGQTIFITKEFKKVMRLVVLRAHKEEEASPAIFQDTRYEYVAFVTTIGQHEMSNEAIVELYRQRSNCENFIKDLKYGFDMHHYPCRSLSANKAYGMMMAVAYNLVRYAGYLLNPMKPKFAKAVRFLLVHIPCQVVRHGRYTTLKMPRERLEEVQRLYDKITQLGCYGSS